MVDSGITIPFVWAMHGYATARDNNEMKTGAVIMMVVPFISDVVFGDTKGYAEIGTQSTWVTLIGLGIVVGIIAMSWAVGYAIGSWRN